VVRPKSEGGSGNTGSLGDMLPLPPFDFTVLQTMEPFEITAKKADKAPGQWQQEFKTNKLFCIGANQSCENWLNGAKATCVAVSVANSHTPTSCQTGAYDEYTQGCAGVTSANICS
jgi:hypothetical protein